MTDHDRLELLLGAIAGDNDVPSDLRTRLEEALAQIAGFSGGRSTSSASTKKIYYHPIVLVNTTSETVQFAISFVIINDSPTAYTLDNIAAAISGFTRISPLCGCILLKPDNHKVIPAYATKSGSHHDIVGFNINQNVAVTDINFEQMIAQSGTAMADNVNAIN